jgi:hypothetical protein
MIVVLFKFSASTRARSVTSVTSPTSMTSLVADPAPTLGPLISYPERTIVSRRILALFTAAAALLVLAPTGAEAKPNTDIARRAAAVARRQATSCSPGSFTPSTVTVAGKSVVATFGITGDCPIWWVEVPDLFVFATEESTTESFNPILLSDHDAGSHAATFNWCDAAYSACSSRAATFGLRRATSWGATFDATPEPVVKNTTLHTTGKLSRRSWEQGRYSAYAPSGGTAILQFQEVGGHMFDYKPGITIGAGGLTRSAVTGRLDGAWRYRFVGNVSSGLSYSSPDYVDVR